MNVLGQFFYPDFGVEKLRNLWAVINAIFYITAFVVPTFLLFHLCFVDKVRRRRQHVFISVDRRSNKILRHAHNKASFKLIFSREGLLSFVIVFAVYFVLAFLHVYWLNQDERLPYHQLLLTIYNLLNPVLNLEQLISTPWAATPGFNFLYRGMLLLGFAYIIYIFGTACVRASSDLKKFARRLIEKLIRKKLKDGEETDSPIVKFFKWFMLSAIGLGGGAAVTNIEATQDYVTPFLNWLKNCINVIAEITNFPVQPDSALDLMYGFFVILLCVCFILILATIFIAFAYLLICLVKYAPEILASIKENWKTYLYAVLMLFAFAIAGVILFLIVTEYETIRAAIAKFIADSPASFIGFITGLVRFGIQVSLLIILVFFIMMLYYFVKDQIKATIEAMNGSERFDRVKSFILKCALVGIPALLLLGIMFLYYDGIADLMKKVFIPEAGGVALTWMLSRILLAFALTLLMFAAGMFLIAVFVTIYSSLSKYFRDNSSEVLKDYLKNFIAAIFGFVPILTNFISEIAKQFIILSKLFTGFKSEYEKNAALYVAASFTSIASFLNTFFGLYEFNRSKGTIIPGITSFTIAGGVQLAMLIIGMRAGQYTAERMISDSRSVGSSKARAITKKTLLCVFYIVGIVLVTSTLWRQDGGLAFLLSWPLVFGQVLFIAAVLILLYMIVLQVLDIITLTRRACPPPGSDLLMEKPKRIGAFVCFVVYIVLMVVSSGFAFNNLFGRYADQVNLHEQTYDQIRIETDKLVDEKLNKIMNDYSEQETGLKENITKLTTALINNQAECEDALEKQAQIAGVIYEELIKAQYNENQASLISNKWYIENTRVPFAESAAFHKDLFKLVLSIVNTDYDQIGQQAKLNIKTYTIEKDGKLLDAGGKIELSGLFNGKTITIGSGSSESNVKETDRTIENADKYKIISELLQECFVYSQQMEHIVDEIVDYKTKDFSVDFDHTNLNNLRIIIERTDYRQETHNAISALAVYDDIRLSFLNLYKSFDSSINTQTSMQDLPWLIDGYLAKCEDDANLNTSEKEENFARLSGYIGGALKITDIFNSANRLLNETDNTDIQTIRGYLNYANGLTNSDFQISYDTLLKGKLGMRPDKFVINAVDRSWAVAIFILLICVLVDLMAFFSGLLLFQDAFLLDMKQNDKLKQLGYISYDAALTGYFAIPDDMDTRGKDYQYRLALIYYLLYCNDASLKSYVIPKLKGIDEDLLMPMVEQTKSFLEGYCINDQDPDFHRWLMGYVQANNISFDSILP